MKKKAICMLITLAVAISVCCALSLSADAADDWITSGSLKFILTSDGNSYAVAAANTSITTADIPSTFSGKPVTTISYRAFRYCTELTSVTIPDSVTSIGDYAFIGCTGLTSVTISERVTSIGACAFYGCTGLTGITIPNGVKSIGACTFKDCVGLTDVTMPDSVTSIGNCAFEECSGLTSINL